jgi:hypothetical protein
VSCVERDSSHRTLSLISPASSPPFSSSCVISVAEFLPFDTQSFDFNVRIRNSPSWHESGGGKLSLVSLEYAVEQVRLKSCL